MESLLSFLLWVGMMVFMIRAGRVAQTPSPERADLLTAAGFRSPANHDLRWVPPERDIDPVCARTVLPAQAKPSVHAGQVYYFCSRQCREVFEVAPDLYLEQHRNDWPGQPAC